jgi:hypothetical protein
MLAAFAAYMAFVIAVNVTSYPPKHGHAKFFWLAMAVLAVLGGWAAYGARQRWRKWRSRRLG